MPANAGAERRERLRRARLYFVTDALDSGDRLRALLDAALVGGADMVQLRDKAADDGALLRAAVVFRELADAHESLFWLNDRPDLAGPARADGVHVGQEDAPVDAVRAEVGAELLIGLSTHSPEQVAAGIASGADQLSVGPVHETPTKEGRPAAGLELIRFAAEHAGECPWFAIGGIDAGTIGPVLAAGARRVVVVRAIRDAPDPEAAAEELRAVLKGTRVAG